MKPPVSMEVRLQTLELRRRHSFREVAERTGLPLGTVKTICARSGAFRDNKSHQKLFSLPQIQVSSQTFPAVPELPPQRSITGDTEVDAVLWLREIIGTGQAALIEKAMLGAAKIKTPLKELEKRYGDHLVLTNPGNWVAAFSAIGFANLEGLAKSSVEKASLKHEGRSRFGDALFVETPAELFCIEALAGLVPGKTVCGFLNNTEVSQRFKAIPEFMPHTLTDCLVELSYWNDLYRLRNAVDTYMSEGPHEAYARRCFAFRCLAEIRPRNKTEAISVFRHLVADKDQIDQAEWEAILLNLIG